MGKIKEDKKLILDTKSADKEHDSDLIEDSFAGGSCSEEEMRIKFEGYGWGQER